MLAQRTLALAALHVRDPKSLRLAGSISGSDLRGTFESWQSGADEREDDRAGVRVQSSLRIGTRAFIIDDNGDVRELHGLLQARERTEDFIQNDGFVQQPQFDRFLGAQTLPDGRSVDAIVASPPQGQPETIYLDAKSSMIDRISYDDADGTDTEDYYDYTLYAGVPIAKRIVQSNGDHLYDMTRTTTEIDVDRPIDPSVFTVPPSNTVVAPQPVTVPLFEHQGHEFVRVAIHGHAYTFLLDSGAQAIVLDARVAAQLGLRPEGRLEVAGAQRTGGLGLAALDGLQIGSATLPLRVVTILNLGGIAGSFQIDGILGYPFFAAAEVRLDPASQTMTVGKPGSLAPQGDAVRVDSDRQLVEVQAQIDGARGRFIVDTGNGNELLVYGPFMQQHQGLIDLGRRHFAFNIGVGGSARAVTAEIDELDLGPFRFYNRRADIMMTTQGAFADRFDAGNIGMGILQNLVLTFDLPDSTLYAKPAATFDDGRDRTVYR